MTKSEFIQLLQKELEITSVELQENTKMESIDEWDSLAAMSLLSILDENFGLEFNVSQINSITRIDDIFEIVGHEKFDR